MSNSLLSGIRVLDLTRLLPGPFCTLYLAQMGAEVIKIEEPDGGDYARSSGEIFEQVNRGKKSITLDLREPADAKAFKALVVDADVVVESFRPGVMEKLGCDYETLKKINPQIVYASLTGYGQTGPYRDLAGHDLNYLAYAGVLDQMGYAGGAPAMANVQIADLAGGALTCAIGILSAVIGARESGQGTMVDVSMTDGSLALQVMALASINGRGKSMPRGMDILSGALPNYSIYKCRGGGYIAVGALEPKFFMRVLEGVREVVPAPIRKTLEAAIAKSGGSKKRREGSKQQKTKSARGFNGLERYLNEPDKLRLLSTPLRWALATAFRLRSAEEWETIMADKDACVTPVLRLEESLQNPHIQARDMVEWVNGRPMFAFPIKFDRPLSAVAPSPALGEHNSEILARNSQSSAA